MDVDELRERYEAFGDETVYAEAVRRYEDALAARPTDVRLLADYGFLQECHGRRAIRAAVDRYEQAIAVDPRYDKPHRQLIGALAALGDADNAIDRYRRMVADVPGEVRGYRFLACAHRYAGDYERAGQVIRQGLDLVPDDPSLVEQHGDVYAATGLPDDALTCWQRAFELAPDDYGISMRYSAAALLERHGRLAEAAEEWRFIVDWCERRGYHLDADWPKRELQRLTAQASGA
jgi:tetratricopeptide (TPR) repeat protein